MDIDAISMVLYLYLLREIQKTCHKKLTFTLADYPPFHVTTENLLNLSFAFRGLNSLLGITFRLTHIC